MSLIGKLIGDAAASPIQAVGNIIDGLFTSDGEKLDKQAVLARIAQAPQLIQSEINKVEAAHRSIFVAGWRPFIGWVCGAAIGWTYLGVPVVGFLAALTGKVIQPPPVDTSILFELVLAMLGLGGLRTFEKVKGATK